MAFLSIVEHSWPLSMRYQKHCHICDNQRCPQILVDVFSYGRFEIYRVKTFLMPAFWGPEHSLGDGFMRGFLVSNTIFLGFCIMISGFLLVCFCFCHEGFKLKAYDYF